MLIRLSQISQFSDLLKHNSQVLREQVEYEIEGALLQNIQSTSEGIKLETYDPHIPQACSAKGIIKGSLQRP